MEGPPWVLLYLSWAACELSEGEPGVSAGILGNLFEETGELDMDLGVITMMSQRWD